jgi:hypothetical protein
MTLLLALIAMMSLRFVPGRIADIIFAMSKRRRRIIIGGGVMIAIIILLTILTFLADGESLDATMRRWEAAGGVRTLAQLEPPDIPDEENAAVLYAQIFEIIENLPAHITSPFGETSDTDELYAALAAMPDELFALATEAGRRERCKWDSKLYEDGFIALMPHLANARTLVRILATDIQWQAARGDDEAAIERLEAIMRIAQHAESDPILISYLVAGAIEVLAMDRFWKAYRERASFPPNVRQQFERRPVRERVRTMLLGEGTIAAEFMEDPGASVLPLFLRRREAHLHRRIILDILDELDKPWHEQNIIAIEEDVPFWAVGLEMIMPTYSRAVFGMLRDERQRLAMQASIDIRAYRDEHGVLPVPAEWPMPNDPVTGERIVYELDVDGFVISVPADWNDPGLYWDWK